MQREQIRSIKRDSSRDLQLEHWSRWLVKGQLTLKHTVGRGTLTLSEYTAERWSRRSEIASLVLRITISVPGSLRRRTSVPTFSGIGGQRFGFEDPSDGNILPCCPARSVNPSQSGTPVGKSSRLPMSGYPFGPGGYGGARPTRFRNQYHTGRVTNTGRTRDM